MNFSHPILNAGNGLFSGDSSWNPNKPTLLIYASCHGRTLLDFFHKRGDLCHEYNILRLETGPITVERQKGNNLFDLDIGKEILASADVVVAYNSGARMGPHALSILKQKYFNPAARIITITAPNCSAFCPFAYDGYGAHIGLMAEFDAGTPKEQVWEKVMNGTFNPMFAVRWRIEMGRLIDKDSYHDIGLAQFVARNYRKAKLWMGPSHPSMIVMAYYGAEILKKLGMAYPSEEEVLRLDPYWGAVSGQPETDYEFSYYKFQYPRSKAPTDWSWYRGAFDAIHSYWAASGVIIPQVD